MGTSGDFDLDEAPHLSALREHDDAVDDAGGGDVGRLGFECEQRCGGDKGEDEAGAGAAHEHEVALRLVGGGRISRIAPEMTTRL